MANVRVVTDSASAVPTELAEELDICVVPIQVQFGTESFKEGADLTLARFYELLDGPVIPTTSQPSPGDFVEAYGRLAEETDEILSLHLTSKASGTWQAARLAAQMIDRARISVVDTLTASFAAGMIVIAAAEAAKAGMELKQIMEVVKRGMASTQIFVALPSLKYVRRCGRVPHVQAWVATLLNISPILSVRDGLVEAVERVRTFRGAVKRSVELAERACGGRTRRLAVVHTNALEEARKLVDEIVASGRIVADSVYICDMRGSMAVHGGPGMLGVVVSGV
ncbi:MAG: DegV domain-containing protein [Firmicutes bacterium ADurb.Bin506]|jgi:DegV family protein with EDD domain|nr:MAG: DegV domain-containing protein [Firmicutes bacterium ADurb.Bin506]